MRMGRRGLALSGQFVWEPTPTSAPPPEGEESFMRYAPLGRPTPTSAPPPEGEERYLRFAPLGMSTPTSAPPLHPEKSPTFRGAPA